jgi:hypothetical protein
MFSPLRNRFGIPGVISVIALVFAMLGGAYAASDTSSGNSKASASAKKAKKGPRGPRGPKGPAGPAGPAGPQGASGANGKDGAPGSNGTNGVSVTGSAEPKGLNCKEGGTKFVAANGTTYACNGEKGKEGSPWTAGGTLPEGKTETGVWGVTSTGASLEVAPLSFTIPLAENLQSANVHFNPVGYDGADGADCPGEIEEPTAKTGHLCVYTRSITEMTYAEGFSSFPQVATGGAGVILAFLSSGLGSAYGTWAVTAP